MKSYIPFLFVFFLFKTDETCGMNAILTQLYNRSKPYVWPTRLEQEHKRIDADLCSLRDYPDVSLSDLPLDFRLSIGVSLSQTIQVDNTIEPTRLKGLLDEAIARIPVKDKEQWIKNHWAYIERALGYPFCEACSCNSFDVTSDSVKNLIVKHMKEGGGFDTCWYCKKQTISYDYKDVLAPDASWIKAQLDVLGVLNHTMKMSPVYRLSIELASVLGDDGLLSIDKIRTDLKPLLEQLNMPLVFFHHYTNPGSKPHLFEKSEDIDWFAQTCAAIVKECPTLTMVVPMNQPMAFSFGVSKGTLPPFFITCSTKDYVTTIMKAQVAAAIAMKQEKPDLKVLISHQWKPMKAKHNTLSYTSSLERMCCFMADLLYNQAFVKHIRPHIHHFDGIALSVYNSIVFNGTTPEHNNCTGIIDASAALESIVKTHQAFPDKPIFIVETGLNSPSMAEKEKFVRMMFFVCKKALNMGIPVKGCYFWGQANGPYFEWNRSDRSHFGPFESESATSMNQYGHYLKKILALE